VAIVNILRNRGEPDLALQVLTLTVGLAVESVLLCSFFLIPFLPYLFKWARRDRGLRYGHLPPLLAMLAAWILVVVIGLRKELPNILFPCSDSTSMVCRVLITYSYYETLSKSSRGLEFFCSVIISPETFRPYFRHQTEFGVGTMKHASWALSP